MKKLLLILLCIPFIGFGQQTYVPDDNFEAYLEANGLGNGIANDDSVNTSSLLLFGQVGIPLNIAGLSISDLTGIEDFTNLTNLNCAANQLTSLDISNNTSLTDFSCGNNQLTSLDVSNNANLTNLNCGDNQLTSLDVSNNANLTDLYCSNNQLTSLDVSNNANLTDLNCGGNQLTNLDVSNNPALTYLFCSNNQLTTLDVRNGNNNTMVGSFANNPNLTCINVDDFVWSTTNWTSWIDPQHYFSNSCINHYGCTDTLACNYNSLSVIDDGSCIYSPSTSMILGNSQTNFLVTETYSVSQNIGSIFNWHLNNGGIIVSGQTTNSVEIQWGNSSGWFELCVIETGSNGCVGDSICLLINVISATSVQEHTTNKELLKVTDLLGREKKGKKNEPLFYIYDDGTVEKRITID